MFDGAAGILRGTALLFAIIGVLALGLKVASWLHLDQDEPYYHRAR